MRSLVVCLTVFTVYHRISSQRWNYADLGPDVWSVGYGTCAGRSQSPINIRTACTSYQSFASFQFSSAYNLSNNLTLRNDGFTVRGRYMGDSSTSLTLTGGGLNGTYQFVDFHLHWGENYKSGSEHEVNGMKYAGEIHFVHRHLTTGTLAVLGIFMQSSQVASTNNTSAAEWIRYFVAAENLQATNSSTVLSLNLTLLMGTNLNDFWRYEGSLTIPPCTEGVIWTVFTKPIVFTEDELSAFRKNLISTNHRSPEPLYNRMVYRNYPNETLSLIPDYQCCSKTLSYNSANGFFDSNMFLLIIIFFLL